MGVDRRPSRDETWLAVARIISKRSTCARRAVGCVLIDARGHVASTGYNGRAAGLPHCNDTVQAGSDFEDWGKGVFVPKNLVETMPHVCPAATAISGTNLDGCEAIHAEQNALLQCRDVHSIHTCYVTTSPCLTCVKLLLNTSCERIVFAEPYPHETAARALWESAGRLWSHIIERKE